MKDWRKLNCNTQFVLPTLIENLNNLAKHESQKNPVIASRLQTICLLLSRLDHDEAWKETVNVPTP